MAGDGKSKQPKAKGGRATSPAPRSTDKEAAVKNAVEEQKEQKEQNRQKIAKAKEKSKGKGFLAMGANVVVPLILLYGGVVANSFRGILWPQFPEMDERTHQYLPKHNNMVRPGDMLKGKLWVAKTAFPVGQDPLVEFDFKYEWEGFQEVSRKVHASVSDQQIAKGQNLILSAKVYHEESGRTAQAKGGLVKSITQPEVRTKYKLLSNEVCPEPQEPAFGRKPRTIARGIPQMQVRLVFDDTAYPYPWAHGPYFPQIFMDEFWLTNDQLVTLNTTGSNEWDTDVTFSLMGVARWRFQRHMEHSLEQNAKMFGEDSEEMLQMRDLFANTHPWLLTATLVVSLLHMVFEFLAFKNDVEFFQGCDADSLSKYVSVQSIAAGIVLQIVLLMYLWDESANLLVLITSVASIAIDVWKVQRAMKLKMVKVFGFIPMPWLVSKVTKEKAEDFDGMAMKYLGLGLTPFIIGYAIYSLGFECHRGWYSYFLFVSSSCVYSLGFILMTPQIFINYKHKSVAYLPWRKFVYRAITTFIDDLFAFIIRMPTMHRMSCFRDDIVFIIYLYQRWLYPTDMSRAFDEDGYELSPEEVATMQRSSSGVAAEATETKKSK